jgi:DNA topoisomerase VI subunit A
MSDAKYLFERAKKAALVAINAERDGNLSTAFDNFLLAAEIINKLIKLERSQAVRDSYYAKAKEYINRAKEIKTIIDAKQSSVDLDLPSREVKSDLPPPPPKTPPNFA